MLPCAGVTAWNALDSLETVQEHSSALLQGEARSLIHHSLTHTF